METNIKKNLTVLFSYFRIFLDSFIHFVHLKFSNIFFELTSTLLETRHTKRALLIIHLVFSYLFEKIQPSQRCQMQIPLTNFVPFLPIFSIYLIFFTKSTILQSFKQWIMTTDLYNQNYKMRLLSIRFLSHECATIQTSTVVTTVYTKIRIINK